MWKSRLWATFPFSCNLLLLFFFHPKKYKPSLWLWERDEVRNNKFDFELETAQLICLSKESLILGLEGGLEERRGAGWVAKIYFSGYPLPLLSPHISLFPTYPKFVLQTPWPKIKLCGLDLLKARYPILDCLKNIIYLSIKCPDQIIVAITIFWPQYGFNDLGFLESVAGMLIDPTHITVRADTDKSACFERRTTQF